ncbi:MAG: hypothetical protein CM1200mP27_08870 [Chloroflexota bacterium]|nr:MAG: hypothetical protein CM1200mP27_08870 [Chloroflexota bacterium]
MIRDNPQLARLLTSRFQVLIAGHIEDGITHQTYHQAPKGVSFVCLRMQSEEISLFASRLNLLRLILNSGTPHSDEIVGLLSGK